MTPERKAEWFVTRTLNLEATSLSFPSRNAPGIVALLNPDLTIKAVQDGLESRVVIISSDSFLATDFAEYLCASEKESLTLEAAEELAKAVARVFAIDFRLTTRPQPTSHHEKASELFEAISKIGHGLLENLSTLRQEAADRVIKRSLLA